MFKVGPLNKGFKGIKVVVEHIEDTDGILGYSLLFCDGLFLCGGVGRLSPLCGGGGGSRLSFAQHSDLSQDMPLSTDTCSQTLWKVHLWECCIHINKLCIHSNAQQYIYELQKITCKGFQSKIVLEKNARNLRACLFKLGPSYFVVSYMRHCWSKLLYMWWGSVRLVIWDHFLLSFVIYFSKWFDQNVFLCSNISQVKDSKHSDRTQ